MSLEHEDQCVNCYALGPGVQSAFQQILGDKFTFQQDNNLKHKAKYTLELVTKTTLNVPSYSFDLNRLENLWQDLKMAV